MSEKERKPFKRGGSELGLTERVGVFQEEGGRGCSYLREQHQQRHGMFTGSMGSPRWSAESREVIAVGKGPGRIGWNLDSSMKPKVREIPEET